MRILHISLDTAMGGIESFLLNVYRNIDKEKLQFDFIEYGEEERDFDYKYKELGARIYRLPDRRKHPIRSRRELERLLKKNNYKVVHIHKNSLSEVRAIEECKKAGVPKIIVHSHNSSRDNKLVVLLHRINQKVIRWNDIYKFACSSEAAEWLFGTTDEVTIVKNGIDTDRFDYNLAKRIELRELLGIENCFVFGNIGRLTRQKNPLFMIEVMNQLPDDDARLLWVGDGELRGEVEKKVKEYGLENKIILPGAVSNPEDYYQAMDIFVMPSIYEGFPIVAVEAQCSGLSMILSDRITKEANITGETEWATIDNLDAWLKAIEIIRKRRLGRKSNRTILQKSGYDMKNTAAVLQDFYLNDKLLW